MDAGFIIMPARNSRRFVLLMLMQIMMFSLLSGARARAFQEWETLSEEENLQMEIQLKVINKPPIRSFKTEYGDILDCIYIYKQHAFDHPLLKDHKVQMRPKRIPEEGKSSMKTKSPPLLPKNIRCPPGSVLIKRTTKEDLIMAKEIKALGLKYPSSSRFHSTSTQPTGYVSAFAEYTKHNFGAKANINVWNPRVSRDQMSLASIWIANGPMDKLNVVQAGWRVQQRLYSSNYTRLFTYWTADGYQKTGCYDYLCPGFVQTSQDISLGLVLKQISTYKGTQQELKISLIKDDEAEWWLRFEDQYVGYWPKKLFSYMYGGANFITWGGQIYSPTNEPSPAMGSGHLPAEGHDGISAYFKQMQIWDNQNFVYPEANSLNTSSDRPNCYGAQLSPDEAAPYPMDFFYGGPGNC